MQAYNAEQLRLLRRYMGRQERLAAAGGVALTEVWQQLGTLDEAALDEFRTTGTPIARTFAAEASALTAGYIAALAAIRVAAANVFVEPDWRGPFIRSWAAMGGGATFEAAVLVGASQVDAIGRNAVVSAARRAGDEVQSDRIVGWNRVLDADPCDWCVMVSNRLYKSAESADFGHDRCACGVTPVFASNA